MPAKLTIHPTKLEFGYFYSLDNNVLVDAADPDLWEGFEDSLFSTDPKQSKMFKCTVIGYEKKQVRRFKCTLNPNHGKSEQYSDYQLDIRSGPAVGAFVPESDHVVISERLAQQLKESELKGWRAIPCKVTEINGSYKPEELPNFYQLAFDGIEPRMRPHVEPRSEDKCPFCETGPLVCSDCGQWGGPCRHCGKEWCVLLEEHRDRTDPRVVIVDPAWPPVFDIRHWDGTDFMGYSHGGWITRRALDWLLSIHAAPFRSEPIAVNVAGLTKAELARLQEVRKPLPNVTPPALENFTKRPRK